ncbi:uncharacterized protein C2orf42 homolog isoform X2 [Daktulosphaira vitifoliae]|uniref:uncharacterized protein C2orf42 homolog isoform X2 n=1 Tax=Daktulosphaira vitifoliae TaxID=58002 RepID=UPI0021AA80F2|nr:uncharacterized protein C2orf42 homolog isoform X2 [Daktulosphaira vitifoliae]
MANSRIKSLFPDLGKSTKRGVKKCLSCGTYNGTRTVVCKSCYRILRSNSKKVSTSKVCQLLTSCSFQIFSYTSFENADLNERGFVYFPEVKNKINKNKIECGICLVQFCIKSSTQKIQEAESNINKINNEPCKHVRSCLNCISTGIALKIDQHVLESFRVPQNVKQDQIPDLNTYFCCHYIACLSAIASSHSMVQEFEKNLNAFVSVSTLTTTINQLDNLPNVQVAMVEESNGPVTFFDDPIIISGEACSLENLTSKHHQTSISNIVAKKQYKKGQNKLKIKRIKSPEQKKCINPNPEISFEMWLASVTERINQEMHYQFDGNPPTMVFHIHKTFFYCLRERMCATSTKKRLPNSTTVFIKKDSLPLGTFTKYTWHITNIMLVKKIFETSLLPLKISRSFIKTSDGTYEEFEHNKNNFCSIDKAHQAIQPNDLKTYLKVGVISLQQDEPIPFIIDWIPDVLPVSQIGELRLTFKYGHMPPKDRL